MAGVIVIVGLARIAYHPDKRAQIGYVHSSLLLLLSFLVLPATSMKVRERFLLQLQSRAVLSSEFRIMFDRS